MAIEVIERAPDILETYSSIPIRYPVESVLRVEETDRGLGGLKMTEEKLTQPYVKDYDAYEDRPRRWPKRFDVSNWGFFLASDANQAVGGAVVAFRSAGVNMLEGRTDLAVLWDIRVHPDRRREGIGTSLFRHVVTWARERNCTQLKIETQNINVPACRFYAGRGCRLGAINRYGYRGDARVAHETMLLWYLDL